MYYKYHNFTLLKGKNFVILQADEECVLEKFEDDFNFGYKQCDLLKSIIYKKCLDQNYVQYHIYTLKTSLHNSLTDYKKIWKLGKFQQCGKFDGYYDLETARVYFGIGDGSELPFSNAFLNQVTLLVPIGEEICFLEIFNVFKENFFNSNLDENKIFEALKELQQKIRNSIAIYEFPHQAKIVILGQLVEEKFDVLDLPQTDIIEY